MSHRAFKLTPLAVALQAASFLVIAGGLFGILISDIIRHRAEIAKGKTAAQVQLFATPYEIDVKSR
jgi:hypothetical protein